jgi:hypothetical protein
MPSTVLRATAALAVAAPLAAAAAAVLRPTSTTAVTTMTPTSAATAAIAATTTRSPATALLSASSAAAVVRATTPSPFVSSASRLVASARIHLPPSLQLPRDARDRARAYLEACATDSSFGGPWRSLSDSIAWMEVGHRATEHDAFGPTPFDLVGQKVDEGIAHLAARSDDHPPDFDANDLIRLIYLYPAVPYVLAHPTVSGSSSSSTSTTTATKITATSGAARAIRAATAYAPALAAATGAAPAPPPPPHNRLPRDIDGKIRTALLNWKYWIDEGGPDDMVYWSENHQILFPTAEYLAGQLMPNERFTNSGMRGIDHKNKARPRVLRWLDERLKFGFNEWNSPGYYEEDFKALFNLVDFADDPLISRRASMVLDLMIFDLARFTEHGSFGVTSGRCYQKIGGDFSQWKANGWQQSVGNFIQILFGTRGRFDGSGAVSALFFATSQKYEVPAVLCAIGQDKPDYFVDRSRVSLDFDEGNDWGIGTKGLDDGMFWWAKGAYMAKQTIANTRWMIKSFNVHRLGNDIKDTLGFAYGAFLSMPDGALYAAADTLSPVTEGMCLTKANLYTYRNKDVMLSSVQDYRRGQVGPQQQVWQATLGMESVVFTTLPGKHESDGPGYWTGSAALPSAIQHENAVIVAYDAPMIVKVSQGLHRTHAWLDRSKFDEIELRRGSNLHGAWGVTSHGTWLFARKGNGYVGLYSNEGYDSGSGANNDWVSSGSWTNVYVCQVGNPAEFGSFENFKNQVTAARIYIHYPHFGDWSPVYCGYDIPGKGRLELHYGDRPAFNGQQFSVDDFPRYENPYTSVPWGLGAVGIRHQGMKLIHLRDTVNPQNPKLDVRLGDGL